LTAAIDGTGEDRQDGRSPDTVKTAPGQRDREMGLG